MAPGPRVADSHLGDPLAWLWAHASGVRSLLELAAHIDSGDDEGVSASLTMALPMAEWFSSSSPVGVINRCLREGEYEEAARVANALFADPGRKPDELPSICYGGGIDVSMRQMLAHVEGLRGFAKSSIEVMLDQNPTVRRKLRFDEDRPTISFDGASLLGFVYHHVSEIVAGPLR